MKKFLLHLVFVPLLSQVLTAQPVENPEAKATRMQWFKDAKLGIFIHWGIYAVDGIDESWSFYNELLPYDEYMDQLDGFTASDYHPDNWAELIKVSGARYAVLTSKHHDGVALWDTRVGDLSVVKKTPAGRDLIGPFCDALRKEDIKVGLYYSLLDWSHPDYPNFTKTQKRYTEDPPRWNRFLEFNMGQLKEIITQYNPDLVWFDGDWEQSAETWGAARIRSMLLENNPGVIINSRLQGYGDYATPEQGIPVSRPSDEYWELCMTMNNHPDRRNRDRTHTPGLAQAMVEQPRGADHDRNTAGSDGQGYDGDRGGIGWKIGTGVLSSLSLPQIHTDFQRLITDYEFPYFPTSCFPCLLNDQHCPGPCPALP